MNQPITKPLWQMILEDKFFRNFQLPTSHREQIERQMIADTNIAIDDVDENINK